MSRRLAGSTACIAVLLVGALLGDGARWTARYDTAQRERAVQDTAQADRVQASDAVLTGMAGGTQSAATGQALDLAAGAGLAAELAAARAALTSSTTAPAALRAQLSAQIDTATTSPSSPAQLAAATVRLREARTTFVAAVAAAAAGPSQTPSPSVTSAGSCASTYTGPPFYTSAPTPDGDGSNGHLPSSAMTALSWAVDDSGTPFYLRTDAAGALERLNIAFTAAFGHPLDLDLTYRDYATQVAMRAALGTVAAVPGTSAHGTGLAIDVPEWPCSYGWDTPARAWLLRHGPAFGWVQPTWARPGGSNPEYWHYEFRG